MGENSNIEWCKHTFNPWIGCTKVSGACDNCYAEALDKRWNHGARWGPHADRIRTAPANWKNPLKWNRECPIMEPRPRVFCASLADIFDNHKSIQQEWRDDLWRLIRDTLNMDWLLLTKRPQNIGRYLPDDWGDEGYPNVWLGTTVENQEEAERRIPFLLNVPATFHFLSCEPLLGPVDLHDLKMKGTHRTLDALNGMKGIDWVIAGGESGPNARPMYPDWARHLRDQCEASDTAFHFKQWGEWAPGENVARTKGVVNTATWFGDKWFYSRGRLGHRDDQPDLYRIGKKAAGRMLDGRTHDEGPLLASYGSVRG